MLSVVSRMDFMNRGICPSGIPRLSIDFLQYSNCSSRLPDTTATGIGHLFHSIRHCPGHSARASSSSRTSQSQVHCCATCPPPLLPSQPVVNPMASRNSSSARFIGRSPNCLFNEYRRLAGKIPCLRPLLLLQNTLFLQLSNLSIAQPQQTLVNLFIEGAQFRPCPVGAAGRVAQLGHHGGNF